MNTPASRLMVARDDPRTELSNRMKIVSIIATSLCVSVVLLVLASYANRASRSYMDRVSFRMVVLALLSNLATSITLLCYYVQGIADCLGFMWSLQFFGQLCSNISLCIGLNLMLVMIWRQDGRKLEKWYFIGSILHALIVTLPPVFAKAWGVDPLTGTCGYTPTDPSKRRSWRLATVLAWPLLDIIGELITFACILIFMVRSKVFNGNFLKSLNRKTWTSNRTINSRRRTKYRMVILRIALYPLSAAISVILLVCSDIYTNRKNPSIQVSIVLIPIAYFVRPLLYSLITILDPSLLRALRTLFNIARGHSEEDPTSLRTETGHATQPISIATVVSVSHSYPNEYELDEASPPGSGTQDNKGHHSNDVILPRTPSPTKDFQTKYPPGSDTGNRHGVTLDLPRAVSDVDSELGPRDIPSRLRRNRRPRSHSEASEDSSEFLKQL